MAVVNILERFRKREIGDEEFKQHIRSIWVKRLQWGYRSTHEEQLNSNLDFIKSLKKMDMSGDIDKYNTQEYELPSEFQQIIFGKSIKQSGCYFKEESKTKTLDEATDDSHELYCERAQIKDGQTVLDIGCGNGGLVLYIAQKYKNCHVTGLTNSKAQVKHIELQTKKLNLTNVEVILADVTKHVFKTEKTFDRIILIQVIEHMKNIELFMRKLSTWMTEESLLFVDHICHKTFNYHFEPMDENDWYSGHIFPEGCVTILSSSSLLYFQKDVSVLDHWVVNGKHMARSAQEWLKSLDDNMEKVREILEPSMGGNKEAVDQVLTQSRFFCMGAYEQFSNNNGEEWMFAQLLFKKK
nr:putative N-methyltransferase [synthetic construct]